MNREKHFDGITPERDDRPSIQISICGVTSLGGASVDVLFDNKLVEGGCIVFSKV